jgi:putative methylase
MIPSKKDLEIILSTLKSFEKPKVELEQYMTPSSLAAEILWQAYLDGNIEGKFVVDFGCGTGILALGAAILGASKVIGYDSDEEALKIAKENYKLLTETKVPACEVVFIAEKIENVEQDCNTVIMNPPFGIQGKKGSDKKFLERAFQISDVVYSFHKIEKTNFPVKVAEDSDFIAALIAEEDFPIKASMEFHEKKKHVINVGLWRFVPK